MPPDDHIKARASSKAVARVYLKALSKRPWLVLLLLLGAIGLQVAELTAPLYLKDLFNTIAGNTPTPAVVEILMALLVSLTLVYLAGWTSRRITTATIVVLESRTMADLTISSFEYLIGHSQHFFSSQFTGTLTRRVKKFADAFETLLDTIVLQFFPTLLFVVGAVVILYTRSPILGIVLGVWAILLTTLQIWLTNWRQPLRIIRSEEDSKVSGALADALGNQTTVTLFASVPNEQTIFKTAVDRWRKATIKSWTADEYIWGILGLFMTAAEIALLYIAIGLWQQGILTIGDFVLIQAYLLTTFDRVVGINRDLRRFYSAGADASEMVAILEEKHGIQDVTGATELHVTKGAINLENVTFSFDNSNPVLKDFNLSVQPNEKLALVGTSGAGKSTITKILLRLYDVTDGKVLIDGQEIREVTQASLRSNISYVPQEPILFHRSLKENIRYGKLDATDEEIIEAAKKAHCHEFISGFPYGYDTYVGERGVKLSGGERQRVAIARAILKNAPILILDEATSALDSESESLIQDALKVLMEGKTVIVIAHRLSTIMKMDRIVVIEDGRIAAEGTHDDLLLEGGLYHKLWSIQAGSFLADEETQG